MKAKVRHSDSTAPGSNAISENHKFTKTRSHPGNPWRLLVTVLLFQDSFRVFILPLVNLNKPAGLSQTVLGS